MVEKSKIVYLRVKELTSTLVMINRVRHNATNKIRWALGSSCHAQKALTIDETEKILGVFLNITPASPSFKKTIDDYWANINVLVNDNGKKLEIGWLYKDEESAKKCSALKDDGTPVIPEEQKYKYGSPINYADYILWRYCLVASSVAKNAQLVNKSPKIKFYLQDKEQEAAAKDKMFKLELKALEKAINIIKDASTRKYVAIMLGIPTTNRLDVDVANDIREYASNNPVAFLATADDELLKEKCLIKSILNQPGSPIIQPANSSVIMYKNESVANSIDELATKITEENYLAMKNEMVLYYKSKQA